MLIVGGLAVVIAAFIVLDIWDKHRNTVTGQPSIGTDNTIEYNGKTYVPRDDIETFLFLGLDKFEADIDNSSYNNDQQADFLLLVVIDHTNKTYTGIQINRDTMVDMKILGVTGQKVGTVNAQIALSHTYGDGGKVSCRNVADSVSLLFNNITVDHYMSLTLDAIPAFNDFVGGVEVEVLDDFTGIDETLVKGEKVMLMGEHALTYVRSRYGMDDSTNGHRMIRQKQYLEALYDKAMTLASQSEIFIAEAIARTSEYMISNCSVNQLEELYENIASYKSNGIKTIEGTNKTGTQFIEFYPDTNSLKKLTVELFYVPKN